MATKKTATAPKKTAPKKPAPKKPAAKKAAPKPSAAAAYTGQVQEILAVSRKPSAYAPAKPRKLRLTNLRTPKTPTELAPQELAQLSFVLGKLLPDFLANGENCTEAAEIVDARGKIVYRLYAWSYGVGYLFGTAGPEDILAMGTQHDIEVWHRDQRDVFWEVDHALTSATSPLGQPLSFDWQDESDWEDAESGKTNPERTWFVEFLRKRSKKG